jgi:hypothetical protein
VIHGCSRKIAAMTNKTETLDTLPAEEREVARAARRIVVVTGEKDDDYADVRAAALNVAAETGAEVILYDHSAESHFVDPYIAGPVAAEVRGTHGESLLDEHAAETLGRAYLANQIREARTRGVKKAGAWLPLHTGSDGIAECVSRFGAGLVIVAEAFAKGLDVGAPVLVVGGGGKASLEAVGDRSPG